MFADGQIGRPKLTAVHSAARARLTSKLAFLSTASMSAAIPSAVIA